MSLQLNPVIGRELKERVRGLRAFIAMTVFVIVLVLTAFFVYESATKMMPSAPRRISRRLAS